jgi:hypothetical protein
MSSRIATTAKNARTPYMSMSSFGWFSFTVLLAAVHADVGEKAELVPRPVRQRGCRTGRRTVLRGGDYG